MYGKKYETKFTIGFNRHDASHLQVADILNRQKRYGKAQYIVDAVMHYVNGGLTESASNPVRIDEKHIEAVVRHILSDRQERGETAFDGIGLPSGSRDVSFPASENHNDEPTASLTLTTGDETSFSEAVDAIGEDGLDAIAGALDMFRRK